VLVALKGIVGMRTVVLFLLLAVPLRAADPLQSWNEGAAKKAVLDFVAKVTKEGSPDFVPPAERVAVFDNDGTLWTEQPMYNQLAFAIDRVKALAGKHPEWKLKEPFKGILDGDLKAALAGGEKAALELIAATHAGMTVEEFEGIVKDWPRPRGIRNSTSRTPNSSISRCSKSSHTCGPTDSKRTSFPAAGSISCGPGPKRSTASRPNRSSGRAGS
jgi:hypothetical protein